MQSSIYQQENYRRRCRRDVEGVRILVIDEVSFLTHSELLKLDENLEKIGVPYKVLGGYSIVFGGDFQKIKPMGVKNNQKYGSLLHKGSLRIASTV